MICGCECNSLLGAYQAISVRAAVGEAWHTGGAERSFFVIPVRLFFHSLTFIDKPNVLLMCRGEALLFVVVSVECWSKVLVLFSIRTVEDNLGCRKTNIFVKDKTTIQSPAMLFVYDCNSWTKDHVPPWLHKVTHTVQWHEISPADKLSLERSPVTHFTILQAMLLSGFMMLGSTLHLLLKLAELIQTFKRKLGLIRAWLCKYSLRHTPRRLFVLEVVYFVVQLLSRPYMRDRITLQTFPTVHLLLFKMRCSHRLVNSFPLLWSICLTCASLSDQFAGASCNSVHNAPAKSPEHLRASPEW